jgi:hypothetical protein
MITLTKDQAFELKMLAEKLQNEVNAEQKIAKSRAAASGGRLYRTSDTERDAQKGLDVVNSIIKQHEQNS